MLKIGPTRLYTCISSQGRPNSVLFQMKCLVKVSRHNLETSADFKMDLFKLHLAITKTCLFIYIENFTTKNRKFSDKNSDIFYFSAQKIDCGYSLEPSPRGGSNESPQSMFLSKTKKNNVYPCKSLFYYIKVGFEGVNII